MKNAYIFLFLTGLSLNGYSQTAACSGNDPGGNPAQHGLYAEYYAGYYNDDQTYFNNAVGLTRVDTSLNFNANDVWGNIVPPATGTVANPENYSTRWRGSIYIAVAGTYTFYLLSDDASYLWLDNAALASPVITASATINNGGLHSPATVSAAVVLSAGMHPITIHFGENTGQNRLVLEYSSSSISRRIVPSSILCTSINSAPLPIRLLKFEAFVLSNNDVSIKWSTASETNNNYFTVERSRDAIGFEMLTQVSGAGNSTCIKDYAVPDKSPLPGLSYYRLKQTDYDGKVSYSSIVPVTVESMAGEVSIYPNPSSGVVNLYISSSANEIGRSLKVMSFPGKILYSAKIESPLFREQLTLESGCYLLIITQNDNSVITRKIVVN